MAKNYSGLTRKQVVVDAYETVTVDLYDSGPNYFRVLNHGETRIYCGVTKIPNKNDYDFACDGGNVKMFAEPYKRSYLYIYNPTGTPVKVDVLSFYADFDPLTLAFSELKLDLSGYNFETNTAIDSFQCALPAGTNNIGKVTISNMPSDYAKAANQKDYTTTLSNLLTKLTAIHGFCTDRYMETQSGTATSTEVTYNMNGDYHIIELGFYSNDGESEQTIAFVDMDGSQHSMTVKAGEVVNNLSGDWSALKVSGSGDYRMAYTMGAVN